MISSGNIKACAETYNSIDSYFIMTNGTGVISKGASVASVREVTDGFTLTLF